MVYRLATAYEHNWRVSGLTIEQDGLHHLAMGVLSCSILNLEVQKIVSMNLLLNVYLICVNPKNFVRWRTRPSPHLIMTISLGVDQIIFTERRDLATSMVHEYFASLIIGGLQSSRYAQSDSGRELTDNSIDGEGRLISFPTKVYYVVTSIREIQCFTKLSSKGETTMTCTPMEVFFSGTGAPSEIGLRWLLNSLHGSKCPLHKRIHDLPMEVQEMIINHAYPTLRYNIFNRAVFTAQTNIGLPFDFRQYGKPFRTCEFSDEKNWTQTAQSITSKFGEVMLA